MQSFCIDKIHVSGTNKRLDEFIGKMKVVICTFKTHLQLIYIYIYILESLTKLTINKTKFGQFFKPTPENLNFNFLKSLNKRWCKY